jgi:hypothetical protein
MLTWEAAASGAGPAILQMDHLSLLAKEPDSVKTPAQLSKRPNLPEIRFPSARSPMQPSAGPEIPETSATAVANHCWIPLCDGLS